MSKSGILKLGLIGCGLMGSHYADVFGRMDGVSVTACCDPTPGKLKEFSSSRNIPAGYLDYREMIATEDLDGLANVTPDNMHAEIVLAALKADIPLITEKPLTSSMNECLEIRNAGRASRKPLVLNFSKRNTAAVAAARILMKERLLGEPVRIDLAYRQGWVFSRDWGDWETCHPWTWRLSRAAAPLGVLGDLGSHLIDLLRYLSGREVVSVNGGYLESIEKGHNKIGDLILDSPDIGTASLRTDDGVPVRLLCSRVDTGEKDTLTVSVYNSRGRLELNLAEDRQAVRITPAENLELTGSLKEAGVSEPRSIIPSGEEVRITTERPESNYIQFINMIRNPNPLVSSGAPGINDGWAVQAVMDAIVRSAMADGAKMDVL